MEIRGDGEIDPQTTEECVSVRMGSTDMLCPSWYIVSCRTVFGKPSTTTLGAVPANLDVWEICSGSLTVADVEDVETLLRGGAPQPALLGVWMVEAYAILIPRHQAKRREGAASGACALRMRSGRQDG